jgi:REP element-mobilizing transposase RayT
VPLLGYLLTFSTYGTHLTGSEKGSVDRDHCHPATPILPRDPKRESYWREHLNESPFLLNEGSRSCALSAILNVCRHREWLPLAVHVRTSHIHIVVRGTAKPEKMLSDFKAYATRALRIDNIEHRRRYWADHGSTRYLWNEPSLNAAVSYVLDGQGCDMARFPDRNSQ